MSTFYEFKFQREAMQRRIKDPEKEYIRMDVMGIEAHQIVLHRSSSGGGTIIVAGEDEAGKPTLIVMPEGHFYGKLTLNKKKANRKVTGFSVAEDKDAGVTISD